MTDVFYDGEFYEDGERIELLSIGLVNDAGETCYVINGEADYQAAADGNPWLVDNVFPHLPLALVHGRWRIDITHPNVMPKREMRHQVATFLNYCNRLEDRRQGRPETLDWKNLRLWAWYGAYDHVALCQLWGRMIDLPKGVPMWTNDLQQEAHMQGVDLGNVVPREGSEHDALADARWNREAHRWLFTTGAMNMNGRTPVNTFRVLVDPDTVTAGMGRVTDLLEAAVA